MGENYNTGANVLLSISSEAERTAGTSPGKAPRNSPSLDSSQIANLRALQSKPNTKQNDDWQRYDGSTAGNESAMNNQPPLTQENIDFICSTKPITDGIGDKNQAIHCAFLSSENFISSPLLSHEICPIGSGETTSHRLE